MKKSYISLVTIIILSIQLISCDIDEVPAINIQSTEATSTIGIESTTTKATSTNEAIQIPIDTTSKGIDKIELNNGTNTNLKQNIGTINTSTVSTSTAFGTIKNSTTTNIFKFNSAIPSSIKLIGNVSAKHGALLENWCKALPSDVNKMFKDLNYFIELKSVGDYSADIQYDGMFDYYCKRIEIIEQENFSPHTLFHEMGHFLSYVMNFSELTPEFKAIYAQEKNNNSLYNKGYEISNYEEYYAGSFAVYILNPTLLKATAPQTYDYINYDVNQLSTQYDEILQFNIKNPNRMGTPLEMKVVDGN